MDPKQVADAFGKMSQAGLDRLAESMEESIATLRDAGISALPEEMREQAKVPGSPMYVMLTAVAAMIWLSQTSTSAIVMAHTAENYQRSMQGEVNFLKRQTGKS